MTCLKNKMIAGALCALIVSIGFFGSMTNVAEAQSNSSSLNGLSIAQLQQIVADLQKQIQQIMQTIAQRNQQTPNSPCIGENQTFSDSGKQCCAGFEKVNTSTECSADQPCNSVLKYKCVKKTQENICNRSLSGSPTITEKNECAAANGTIRCGNGWCGCSCASLTCAQICNNKGYANNQCSTYAISPTGFANRCAAGFVDSNLSASDCVVDKNIIGVGKVCCCSANVCDSGNCDANTSIKAISVPLSNSNVYAGDQKDAIYGLNIQAIGSNMNVQRLTLQFSASPYDYFSNIYLYNGNTLLASSPLNAGTVSKVSTFDHEVTLSNFASNFTIPKDGTGQLTVKVDVIDALNNVPAKIYVTTIVNGVRAVNQSNLNVYGGDATGQMIIINQRSTCNNSNCGITCKADYTNRSCLMYKNDTLQGTNNNVACDKSQQVFSGCDFYCQPIVKCGSPLNTTANFIPMSIVTTSMQPTSASPASLTDIFNIQVTAKNGDVYIPKDGAFTVAVLKDNETDLAKNHIGTVYSQPTAAIVDGNAYKIQQDTTVTFSAKATYTTTVAGNYHLQMAIISWSTAENGAYTNWVPTIPSTWTGTTVYLQGKSTSVCGNGNCEAGETTTNCQQDCNPPISGNVTTGYRHLCGTYNDIKAGNTMALNFKSIDDTYSRYFMIGIDCPEADGSRLYTTSGCKSCTGGGKYCIVGTGDSGSYTYSFETNLPGSHQICTWPTTDYTYAGSSKIPSWTTSMLLNGNATTCGNGVCDTEETTISCPTDCYASASLEFFPASITTSSTEATTAAKTSITGTFNIRVTAKNSDAYIPKVGAFTVAVLKDNETDATKFHIGSIYSQPAATVAMGSSYKIPANTTVTFTPTATYSAEASGSYRLQLFVASWGASDGGMVVDQTLSPASMWTSQSVFLKVPGITSTCNNNGSCDNGETSSSCPRDCACRIMSFYAEPVSGYAYNNVYLDVINLPSITTNTQMTLGGVDTWNGLAFSLNGAKGSASVLKANQTVNDQGFAFMNARTSSMTLTVGNTICSTSVPSTVSPLSMKSSPISIATISANLSQIISQLRLLLGH